MGDFGIKLHNKTFLDLYPNTSFSYVLNSPFYLGGELGDPIAGNLIFSVKVPLNAHNNKLLRFPGLIDNAWKWIEKADCSVYTEGVAVWFCKLDIIAPSTEREANIRITINSAEALKTLKMNELELGTLNATQTDIYEWAKATANAPDNHNFVFPTVWNPTFWGSKSAAEYKESEVQNLWFAANRNDPAGYGGTEPPPITPALTPMPKLDFTLQKMLQSIGITLENRFQNTHELTRLILYANASLNPQSSRNSNATAYPLSRGLSSATAGTFLRHLCRKFALGLFINQETSRAELLPFKQAIQNAATQDWTRKQLYGYEFTQEIEYPNTLADKLSDTIIGADIKNLPISEQWDVNADNPEGIYNLSDGRVLYYKKDENGVITQLSRARLDNAVNLENPKGKTPYENDIGTLVLSRFGSDNALEYPSLAQRGKDGSEAVTSSNTTADRLLFYRGFSRTGQPFASGETTYLHGQQIKINTGNFVEYDAQNSMDWLGDKGIYNNWWKENHQVVANGKHLKRKMALTINDLQRFTFKNKVRLDNQECFVKKISGVLNRRGLQPAEVEFVTVT